MNKKSGRSDKKKAETLWAVNFSVVTMLVFFYFFFLISFVSAKPILTISQDNFIGWENFASGNESIIFGNDGIKFNGNEMCMIPQIEDNFKVYSDPTDLLSPSITYKYPTSIPVFTNPLSQSVNSIFPSIKNEKTNYCYNLNPLESLWYKFGKESVIVQGALRYNSTDSNITQQITNAYTSLESIFRTQNGFAHLNISSDMYDSADTLELTRGTEDSGSLSDTFEVSNESYNISELAMTPAFEIRFNFTEVINFDKVMTRYWYDGNVGHVVVGQIYDYTSSTWTSIMTFVDGVAFDDLNSSIVYNPNNFIKGGIVQFRIYHSTAGNINHNFFLDYLSLFDEGNKDTLRQYYPFDAGVEDGTSRVYDWSGNGRSGQYVLGQGMIEGVYGNASKTNYSSGSNNGAYINLGNNDVYLENVFTIAFWFKVNEFTGSDMYLYDEQSKFVLSEEFNIRQESSNNKTVIQIVDSAGDPTVIVTSGNATSDKEWHHLAFTHYQTGSFPAFTGNYYLYYDGALDSSGTYSQPAFAGNWNFVTIGADMSGMDVVSNGFNGYFDEWMVFTKNLTSDEVLNIYNNNTRRFDKVGTMLFENINFGTNNSIDSVLMNCSTLFYSNISFKVNSLAEQNFSNCQVNNYWIAGEGDNSNITLTLYSGTNQFISPFIQDDIVLDEILIIFPSNVTRILPNIPLSFPHMILGERTTFNKVPHMILGENLRFK